MLQPEPDIGVCRQMKNKIAAPHRRQQTFRIEQVSAFQPEIFRLLGRPQKFDLSGGKIIESYNRVSQFEQPVDKATPYEPGGAGNESPHDLPFVE